MLMHDTKSAKLGQLKKLSFKSLNVFLFDYFFNIYPLGHRLFSLYVLSVITNQEKLVSEIEFLG